MTEYPLVSVIIPNYNHADYLTQRLQSVLAQSYKNIEVIILDDKSTDDSLDVIVEFSKDDRITGIIVNEENSGNTFKQWEKGIRIAKGELIWIAESDDYCELNMLEELIKAFNKKENTVLAYSTLTLVNEQGEYISSKVQSPNQYLRGHQYLRRYLSLANFVRNASCAIFSREAALKVSSDYLEFVGAGDYLFWVEIASQGNVAIVNKCLSYFRRHSGVVTERRDADGTNFIAEKLILDKIESKVHLSFIRKAYILAYHTRRIRNTHYYSEDIRAKLYAIWKIKRKTGIFGKAMLRVSDELMKKYNYYI